MAKATTKAVINDAAWKKIRARMEEASHGRGVKIGVFQAGEPHSPRDEITTVEIAAIHEFGSPEANIPERSFLRNPIKAAQKDLKRVAKALSRKLVEGEMEHERAMGILGQWGVKTVKNAITSGEGIPPELKKATIDRKGSTRPLVDTGKLLNSITYQVEGGPVATGEGGGEEGE